MKRIIFPVRPATAKTASASGCSTCQNLTNNPGAGKGFGALPAYRVSNGQMRGMQQRLNDCYRQQRFPHPGFGSDATIALSG